jgi:hypothetical protein
MIDFDSAQSAFRYFISSPAGDDSKDGEGRATQEAKAECMGEGALNSFISLLATRNPQLFLPHLLM